LKVFYFLCCSFVEIKIVQAHCINDFKSFVNDNPFLADATYKEIFIEMEEKDVFTDDELKKIKNCIYKIIISDIDELQISEIPENVLQDCMRPSSNFSFTHGRRFFKFLINNKMLEHKYLTLQKWLSEMKSRSFKKILDFGLGIIQSIQ